MMVFIGIVTTVIGGLGLFMFGMKYLSEGTQALAGPRLNAFISAATDNRILAVLVGMGVTAVIQASGATTVMVVGFVNAGIMSLMQAIGVIFGANIGTTVTAWIMTLNLAKYGLFIAGLAALFFIFTKRERPHYVAMMVLGMGLLFYGLQLMAEGFSPLRSMPAVGAWLGRVRVETFSGFAGALVVGGCVTALLQSSSAFIGVVMSLISTQVISFETAVALVLGSNMGTTVTGLIACIGAARNAVRAAVAHSLFNVLGVVLVAPFYRQFIPICDAVTRHIGGACVGGIGGGGYPYPMLGIAMTHTLFNVGTTLLFLPFMGGFARLVTVLIPVRPEETRPGRYCAAHLDKRLLSQPAIAVGRAQEEILLMGGTCLRMLSKLREVVRSSGREEGREEEIFRGEEEMDIAQKEISEYISLLLRENVTYDLAVTIRRQLRQADEFESVSDYIRNALKAYVKIRDAGEALTEEATKEVEELAGRVSDYTRTVMQTLERNDPREISMARVMNRQIEAVAKEFRGAHMKRLAVTCTTPVKSLVYSDMLTAFRRMSDHLLNIAETLEG